MASRMERYHNVEQRSKKNEHLYKQIDDIGGYTNIEGIADISNSNEINIAKVKEMLALREKNLHSKDNVVEYKEEIKEKEKKEQKNYDLKDVLDKAKVKHNDSNSKYRNINKRQYEILKKIKNENPDDEEIDELLNTLSFGSTDGDDLGIFDELKSNTMVGEPSSIKKVLEEAKEDEETEHEITDSSLEIEKVSSNNLDNIDKSFYTSSFTFSDKDFEDLRNLDHSLKTNNKLIKILIAIFGGLLAIVLIIVILNVIF